ncbi:24875_t:CDS:2 [Entrophospora sp. SA101]|nr:15786_t:CDS:2 [Entrophospora sp. SA101]CAJ0746049.1 24875_t:CDS:2 [Entrophospora sp. SA101]CAJ0926793.1 18705_t:CDS:2 [Entrophospora sp. SA101]
MSLLLFSYLIQEQKLKAAFKSLMKIYISSSSYVSDNTNWLMHVDEFGSLRNGDDLEDIGNFGGI